MRKIALFTLLATALFSHAAMADQALAMRSGCLGCHKADAKLVGPAFQDVATKYADETGAVDRLADKVKAGSTQGEPLIWGAVAMPPSPAKLEDIKGVINWIMTMK
ncbi:MAG: cytochrome C' [Candidatus Thiodiazotropha sp. (ex Epidulcina cf. delphinae)]|nr:cytochrome C' [Candidatus Thiodiazotropha sp. (ex Epidulcina cf. delphinae)]